MDLPQEIVNSVIFQLRHDRSVLLVLCLVCRAFLPEARRCLYRKIALAETQQGSYLPYGCFVLELDRNVQLFTTLTQLNPSLADYIHTFAYIFEQNNNDNDDIVVLLHTSLQLMSRLKDLSLYFFRLPLSRLIQGCTFELEVFRYVPWVTETTGNSIELHEFVVGQASLRGLLLWEMNPHNSDTKFLWPTSTFFHQLKHLTGMATSIEHVLPTCSATSLSLLVVTGGDFRSILNFGQKLENVESLCLHGFFQEEPTVAPIVSLFWNLQILHVSGGLNKDFLLTRFPEVLRSLPNLRIYIQSFPARFNEHRWRYLRGDLAPFIDSQQEGTVSWFKELRYLQAVYMQQQPISEAKCFLVWERGSSQPYEAEASEVWEISPWV